MAVTGIDVSRHQGAVDFGAVKRAGYDFAIIKATEGTSYSYVGWYRTHAPKVEAAGLVLGAYHFLRADSDPAAQARYFVSTVGSFRNRIAVVDVETAANGTKPRIGHVEAFAKEFRRLVAGHPLVVYTGRWYWRDTIGNPTGAHIGPLWHSEYETSQAEVADGPEADVYGGWTGCTIWQWTSSGSCPGVSGRCDLNILRRGTLAALTGSTQPPPPSEEDDMPTAIATDILQTVDRIEMRTVGLSLQVKEQLAALGKKLGTEIAAIDFDPVDEAAVAAVLLRTLTPQSLVDALDDDLAAKLADLLAARLAS